MVGRAGERGSVAGSHVAKLIPQEFSGATKVKFTTPINSPRIFWCKRGCNRS